MIKPVLSLVIAGSRSMGPNPEVLDRIKSSHENVEYIIVTTNLVYDFGLFEKAGASVLLKPGGTTIPSLRAAGLMHASADIVAMTEDFCLPPDDWVRNVINAHKNSDAIAIGGPVRRRNGTAAEWALTFCEYARFMPSNSSEDCKELPAVNISLKKTKLLEIYGCIPTEIEEFQMLPFLLNKGSKLEWNDSIFIYDVNDQSLYRSISSLFFHGRYFGGIRVKNCRLHTKIIRAILFPIIPFLQTFRIAKNALNAGYFRYFLQSIIFILILSSCWAFGEGIGSIFGESDSKSHWI